MKFCKHFTSIIIALIITLSCFTDVTVFAVETETENTNDLGTLLSNLFGQESEIESINESNVSNEEIFQVTDNYVLEFGAEGVPLYAYFSPFVPILTYDNVTISGYSILFGLKNTDNDEIIETAYCTDLPVDAVEIANYRPINLSDSTYAAAHANKLRSILLNSYPHISLETLAKKSGIKDISMCEAITATQLAVWKTAHGDIVEIKDFLAHADAGYNSGYSVENERNAYNNGNDEYKAAVKSRIKALYYYLMSLSEETPSSIMISRSAFVSKDTEPTVTANGDGTYNIIAHTTVNVPVNSDVELTAFIDDGEWYATQELTVGKHAYEMVIKDVPEEYAYDTVTLSIDGEQTVEEEVFLLDARGIRGTSQSMVAPLSGRFAVHAETKVEPDRVIEVYKTESGKPLANISFDIYYIGSVEDYVSGKLDIGEEPTESDIETYAKFDMFVGTVTTDSKGYATLNLGTDDGVYLVKESYNKLIENPKSFFVVLPNYSDCDEYGKPAYNYIIAAENTISVEKVIIEKDVEKTGNKSSSFNVNEEHTWILSSNIPIGIGTAKKYEITDTLDRSLTYKRTESVTLSNGNDVTVTLSCGDDYTVSLETDNKIGDRIVFSLTESGMKRIDKTVGENCDDFKLEICFIAEINANVVFGKNIENKANITYINNLNRKYEDESESSEVHTGGARILKTDAKRYSVLKNAKFKLYREITAEDKESGVEYVKLNVGETVKNVVETEFFDNSSMKGEKTSVLITDENGLGLIYGVAYGTYYLVEIEAPSGYIKLSEPIEITIDQNSHKLGNAVIVKNTADTSHSDSSDGETSSSGSSASSSSGENSSSSSSETMSSSGTSSDSSYSSSSSGKEYKEEKSPMTGGEGVGAVLVATVTLTYVVVDILMRKRKSV